MQPNDSVQNRRSLLSIMAAKRAEAKGSGRLDGPSEAPASRSTSPLAQRDRNGTGELHGQSSKLQLDEAGKPKAPNMKVEGLEAAEGKSDVIQGEDLWAGLSSFVDSAGSLANQGVDLTGDFLGWAASANLQATAGVLDFLGAEESAKSLEAGAEALAKGVDGFVEAMGQGVVNTGAEWTQAALRLGKLVDEHGWDGAMSKLADSVWGPKIPGQEGQFEGLLGEVTSRLNPGEATHLQAGGALGAALGLGLEGSVDGTMQLARGMDGQFYVSFSLQGTAEGTASLDTGAKVAAAGLEAGAKAELGATLAGGGAAKVTMRFDPSKPEDRARMAALLTPAGMSPAAVVNPLMMAVPSPGAFAEALKHNLHSQDLSLQGSLEGKAEAGVQGPGAALGLGGALTGELSLVRSSKADGSRETSYLWQGQAKVELQGELAGNGSLDQSRGTGTAAAFTVTTAANGSMSGMRLQSTEPPPGYTERGGVKEQRLRLALGDAVEGGMAFRTREVSTFVTELSAQGVQRAKVLMAQGKSQMEAFREVAALPGMATITKDTQVLRVASMDLDVDVKLAGVGGHVRAGMGLGTTIQAEGNATRPGLLQDRLNHLVGRL